LALSPEAGIAAVVAQVAPVIEEYRSRQEEERRLDPELVDAFRDAGLWDLAKPAAFGGLECEPKTTFHIVEELSRLDASVGWVVGNASSIEHIGASLNDRVAREVFGTPGYGAAAPFFPPGKLAAADGGYRLTGRWAFATGCHDARYVIVKAAVVSDGQPRTGVDGRPIAKVCAVPVEQVEIQDASWNTLGMRATGSHNVAVSDLFVPEDRTCEMNPVAAQRTGPYAGFLYGGHPWFGCSTVAAVTIGIGQAAVDAVIELATGKVPNFTAKTLRDRDVAQGNVARAQAAVNSARAYAHRMIDVTVEAVSDGRRPSRQEAIECQLSICQAIDSSSHALRLVHETAGSSGFDKALPFERLLRDQMTLSQHAFGSASRFESAGRLMLGLDSDWMLFDLAGV
jgi:alkylation response protein AidB-like acyl-CoA dehydrogenase